MNVKHFIEITPIFPREPCIRSFFPSDKPDYHLPIPNPGHTEGIQGIYKEKNRDIT